jgi:hypothetical protein
MLNKQIKPFTFTSDGILGKTKAFLHMKHIYDFKFGEVAKAFLEKYNEETRFTTTTICAVEQIDENRFQLVRRIENVMSSTPLYDRIIIDRSSSSIQGFTFEAKSMNEYSEHYSYKTDIDTH